MALVYLGLGSNLGDRAAHLAAARRALAHLPDTSLLRNASLYETPPVGGPAGQGLFLNSVSAAETSLEPRELLREIHGIERAAGRLRENETVRWGARPLDIDILFWDDAVLEEEHLTIPHPRAAERLFVLLPMAELDRDFVHPKLGATVGQLLERLTETDGKHEGIRRLPF